jgi:hypothetical protein
VLLRGSERLVKAKAGINADYHAAEHRSRRKRKA